RLREERNWKRLVTLLLGRVERGTDRIERVAVLRGLARLYDGPLDAPDRAFTALVAAFRLEPDGDGLLEDLERAPAKAGTWAERGAALSEAASNTQDAARATLLRMKAAEIHAGRPTRGPRISITGAVPVAVIERETASTQVEVPVATISPEDALDAQ